MTRYNKKWKVVPILAVMGTVTCRWRKHNHENFQEKGQKFHTSCFVKIYAFPFLLRMFQDFFDSVYCVFNLKSFSWMKIALILKPLLYWQMAISNKWDGFSGSLFMLIHLEKPFLGYLIWFRYTPIKFRLMIYCETKPTFNGLASLKSVSWFQTVMNQANSTDFNGPS